MTRRYDQSNRYRARVAIFALAVLIALYGLASRTPEQAEEAEVRTFVDDFLKARLSRDHTAARTFLSNKLHGELADANPTFLTGSSIPHYHAFRIESITPGGKDVWRARVILSEEMPGQGEIGWFQEELVVARVGSDLRIDKIHRGAYQYGAP